MLETASCFGSDPLDIVPAALLEPPQPHQRRGVDRDGAAAVLDAYLRRIGTEEARCRRLLGRLAQRFLEQKAYHRLGFARLSDYSRERLGVSASEVRSLARVAARLEELPRMAAAFEAGTISWSKTRLLVEIASATDEDDWIALGQVKTVRGLRRQIEAAGGAEECGATRPGSAEAPSPAALREVLEESSGRIEGEPAVRFQLRCPRRVMWLWRDVVELARRMLGADGPLWQAAEAITAEGASSILPGTAEIDCAPEGRIVSSEESAEDDSEDSADYDCAETPAGFSLRLWPNLDLEPRFAPDPLARDIDRLDPFELDERMRFVLKRMQRLDWQTGRMLRTFGGYRLYRAFGCSSLSRYIRERLCFCERKGRSLVRLDRKSWDVPSLGDAYREGDISTLRALTILPAIGERNAAEWLSRASSVTLRRLAAEVGWAIEMREVLAAERGLVSLPPLPPPPQGTPLERPERQMCAPAGFQAADAEISFTGPAAVVGLFRGVLEALAAPHEPPWRGLERLLVLAKTEWEAQPRHRDPVFARDGWRCSVPACSSRRNLQDHHREFRSRGGCNELWNRVSGCSWHHLRAIHGGIIRATGRAPDDVVWEIGLRAGGGALMTLRQESYLSPQTS